MPNGGFVWSCAICKWGRIDEYPERTRFWCKNHKIEILFDAGFRLCSDITLTRSMTEYEVQKKRLSKFVNNHRDELKPGGIYAYLETFRNGYIRKIVRLASIAEYASWTGQQDFELVKRLEVEWEKQLADEDEDG